MEILRGTAANKCGKASDSLRPDLSRINKLAIERFNIALVTGTFNVALNLTSNRQRLNELVFERGGETLYFERCRLKWKGANNGVRCLLLRSSIHQDALFKDMLEIMSSCALRASYGIKAGDPVEVEVGGNDEWWLTPDDARHISDDKEGGSSGLVAKLSLTAEQKLFSSAQNYLRKVRELRDDIFTPEARQDITALLHEIAKQPLVVGAIVVGHDAQIIASEMPPEFDLETLGVWGLGLFMNTEHVAQKIGHRRTHQIVCKTPAGYMLIADFGGGLLLIFTDAPNIDEVPLVNQLI